jgi:hypothetical protein
VDDDGLCKAIADFEASVMRGRAKEMHDIWEHRDEYILREGQLQWQRQSRTDDRMARAVLPVFVGDARRRSRAVVSSGSRARRRPRGRSRTSRPGRPSTYGRTGPDLGAPIGLYAPIRAAATRPGGTARQARPPRRELSAEATDTRSCGGIPFARHFRMARPSAEISCSACVCSGVAPARPGRYRTGARACGRRAPRAAAVRDRGQSAAAPGPAPPRSSPRSPRAHPRRQPARPSARWPGV